MKVNINRQLAGLEDIAFGTGTVMQERQGEMVEITKVNLGNLPFSETLSAAEVLTPIYEQVVPHMTEILEADTNAGIATAKAAEASDSAAAALASEQAAAASEGTVVTNAGIATTKAAEASDSAAAALASDQAAAANADIATTKAAEAADSAAAASASEQVATSEGLIATTNATIATTKASEALASASAALLSEQNALASEQAAAISEGLIASHLIAEDNPHSVTKAQVGLSNVDNTSDADKPVSTAQQAALDDKSDDNTVMHLTGDEAISGSKDFTGTLQVNGSNVTAYGKNYLINGGFDYWNYATSQTTNGYGSDDRWNNGSAGSTKGHSRIASTDAERALFNSVYFSRTTVSSAVTASSFVHKQQRIENVTKLAGKVVTISFWAKADTNRNIAIECLQSFGTGGSPSSAVVGIGSQLVALTTSWQKKTITISLPSIIGKTLGTDGVHTSSTGIIFWFDAGSNFSTRSASLGQQSGTFDIAEVKLEEGSVATPWTPYEGEFGGEIQACQRYFRYLYPRFLGYVSAGGEAYCDIPFPTMRTIPTATPIGSAANVANTLATNWSIEYRSGSNVRVYVLATTSLRTGFEQIVSLSAEL